MNRAVRDAVAMCGPLLKVQKEEISLIHQSARDYLLRIERDSDAVLEAFRLNFESSHLELARKCLDCVAQSDLRYRVIDLNAKLDLPLLRYAVLYWREHAKSCSALAAKLFDPSALFFKKKSPRRDYWFSANAEMRGYCSEPLPLLHIACSLEIIPWIKAVGAKKSWWPGYECVNEKDNHGVRALHLAAWVGNEAVVRLLVDKGADIKAKDNKGKTGLHRAAERAKNQVLVRLLMGLAADVEAKDIKGRMGLN